MADPSAESGREFVPLPVENAEDEISDVAGRAG
jgi:hypothetical protein